MGVGAELEWVCTEVGKVGVQVRGADWVDIVAVGVVKRGCGRGTWTMEGLAGRFGVVGRDSGGARGGAWWVKVRWVHFFFFSSSERPLSDFVLV